MIIHKQPQTKAEKIAEWRANIPDINNEFYRRLYDKAQSGKSLRAAVDSKCLDCMCWQRSEIAKCPHIACPLYQYRPYRQTTGHRYNSQSGAERAAPEAPLETNGAFAQICPQEARHG